MESEHETIGHPFGRSSHCCQESSSLSFSIISHTDRIDRVRLAHNGTNNNLSSATSTLPYNEFAPSAPSPVCANPGTAASEAAPTPPAQAGGFTHPDSSSTLGLVSDQFFASEGTDLLTAYQGIQISGCSGGLGHDFVPGCVLWWPHVDSNHRTETLKLKLGGGVLWTGAAVVAFCFCGCLPDGLVLEMAGGCGCRQCEHHGQRGSGVTVQHDGQAAALRGVPILAHASWAGHVAAAASQLGFISAVAACCVLMAT